MKACLLTMLFVFPVSAFAQEREAAAVDLVKKGVAALKLDPAKPSKMESWSDSGTVNFGGTKLGYKAKWHFALPNRFHFDMDLDIGGQTVKVVQIFDGQKCYETVNGTMTELEGDKLKNAKIEGQYFQVAALTPLLNNNKFGLKTQGEKDVKGKKALAVQVTHEGFSPGTIYFDKATMLPVMMEYSSFDEASGFKEVQDTAYFSDYKEVGGRMVYGTLSIVRNGEEMIGSKLSDQKVHAAVEEKLFQKP